MKIYIVWFFKSLYYLAGGSENATEFDTYFKSPLLLYFFKAIFSLLYIRNSIVESGEREMGKKNRKGNKSSHQNIFASLYKERKYCTYSLEKHSTIFLLLFYYEN